MQHPQLFSIDHDYPQITLTSRTPADCTYRVDYAQVSCWRNEHFRVVEQRYDAKHTYLSLVEINTQIPLRIPVSCSLPDLYWLYQLEGSCRLSTGRDAREPGLPLDAEEYVLAYAPRGNYELLVAPGQHLLFFFVVNARWLLRYQKGAPAPLGQLMETLQLEKESVLAAGPIAIHDRVRQQLLRLLSLSTENGMSLDVGIYAPIIELVTISHQDLGQNGLKSNRSLRLAKAVRGYVREQVRQGEVLPVSAIAKHFKVSNEYLRRAHRQHYGYPVQRYIIRKKLEEAMRLLSEERYSVSQTAYHLGYLERTSFYKQFKKMYGISPSEVKQKKDDLDHP